MKDIVVQAQRDHILSLCTASPVQALSELIWNALDADAFDVRVDVVQNSLGGIEQIRIADDGTGIEPEAALAEFGNLGGSWKREAGTTSLSGRALHGSKGRGRFKAFALGDKVEWRTTVDSPGKGLHSYIIKGSAAEPDRFEMAENGQVGPGSGTEVCITGIRESLGSLLDNAGVLQQLSSHFALYLKAYPNVRIYYQGLLVNPVIVQRQSYTYHLKTSTGVHAELDIIEWKTRQGRNKIVFCDASGFALSETDASVRMGSGFNYTAYLLSPRFSELQKENVLALGDLQPEVKAFLDAVRDMIRTHFRERRAALTGELIREWSADGSYPYTPAEAADPATGPARDRFNACVMSFRAKSDAFDSFSAGDRKLFFRLLRESIEAHPAETLAFVGEALDLPAGKRASLVELAAGKR